MADKRGFLYYILHTIEGEMGKEPERVREKEKWEKNQREREKWEENQRENEKWRKKERKNRKREREG